MKRSVRAEWRAVVLVCGRCTKKLGGGFGAKRRTPLAEALRKRLGKGKGRKAAAGIYEVPCLRLCPKGAVTVVNGAEPGRWLVVEAATPVDEVAARLGLLETRGGAMAPSPRRGEGRGEGERGAAERPTLTVEHPHPTLSLKGEG